LNDSAASIINTERLNKKVRSAALKYIFSIFNINVIYSASDHITEQ